MKSLAATLMLMLCSGALLFAADIAAPTTQPATQPATQPTTGPAKPVNKFCPVTRDEAIDPEGKTVEYKGKIIGFCCEDCIPDFERNPEKYMKDLK